MKKLHGNFKYPNILTKKFLIKEYVKKEKSEPQIAKIIGCSITTIRDYLKKYKIKRRTIGEAKQVKYSKILTKKFLIKEYSKNEKNLLFIAKLIGCSQSTVYNYLSKFNILIRNSGRKYNPEKHKKHYCKICGKKISYRAYKYGKGRCRSCASKYKWQDKIFREKTLKASFEGRKISPNKPEKLLNKLLKKVLSKEYKFVGDGKVILGGFCPDFINVNGQKKIIELYGDYWHNLPDWTERDKRRLIAYNKFGYKTLIIWEHELKNLNKVKNKIRKFNYD